MDDLTCTLGCFPTGCGACVGGICECVPLQECFLDGGLDADLDASFPDVDLDASLDGALPDI